MKRIVLLAATLIAGTQAFAAGNCEDQKAELLARLEANQVKAYTLEIMPVDKVGGHKVAGSCEGGAKKIVYKKIILKM